MDTKVSRVRTPMNIKFSDLPDEALVTIAVVCDVSGNRPTTIYAGMKNKTFPLSIKLSQKCARWRVGELRRWLSDPLNYRKEND